MKNSTLINWEDEEVKVPITLNETNKTIQGQIKINFHILPKNCNECPFQSSYYDEDGFWGSGIQEYCIFGGDHWGSAINRPQNCPIVKMKR